MASDVEFRLLPITKPRNCVSQPSAKLTGRTSAPVRISILSLLALICPQYARPQELFGPTCSLSALISARAPSRSIHLSLPKLRTRVRLPSPLQGFYRRSL
jgi:hypothetical protein